MTPQDKANREAQHYLDKYNQAVDMWLDRGGAYEPVQTALENWTNAENRAGQLRRMGQTQTPGNE